jgi:hypothetical protein
VRPSRSLGDGAGNAVVRADVVEGEDVGVVEGGDGAGLGLEAPEAVGVGGAVLREDLEDDVTPEAGIAGAVNLTHPPGSERGQDLVGAEACSGRQRHAATPAAAVLRRQISTDSARLLDESGCCGP